MPGFIEIYNGIIDFFIRCFSVVFLTGVIPAFLIAGAINVFISPRIILKYFGAETNRALSYAVATTSGIVFSVCSCSAVPLYSSLRKRGAALGPSIAFLYSGPALDIPPLVLTFGLLGLNLGWGTLLGTFIIAIAIGLLMSLIYRDKTDGLKMDIAAALPDTANVKSVRVQIVFFGLLVAIMTMTTGRNWIGFTLLFIALVIFLIIFFSRDDMVEWGKSTLELIRGMLPWLIIGTLGAALITVFLPNTIVSEYVGGNTLLPSFISASLGSIMYFCSLSAVPFVRALMDLGMGKGPALSLLLTGSAVSLPSMIVLHRVMGLKKTLTYIGLVITFATIAGYIFGFIAG